MIANTSARGIYLIWGMQAVEMIENIRQEFIHQLDTIDWIDAETRVDAIRKAHNIEVYMVCLL